MVAAESSKIYLIDLDNFAAGAIASTIVNIAGNSYFDRSISVDMYEIGNDAYFAIGTGSANYELFKASSPLLCFAPKYVHIVDGSCKAIVDFPDGYGLDSVTKKTKL